MVARQRLAVAALAAGVLAAAGYLFYLGVIERRAFLPGPVHSAHAGIEHDCEACHVRWGGISNAKCASCHLDPAGREIAFKRFAKHHSDASLDCASCHTDHKGRRGETTTIAAAAYAESCERCHAGYEKQKGAFQGVLVWNHADHTGSKGLLRCDRCHDARPSERAQHGRVTIARPDCFNVACHVKPLKKPQGFVLGAVRAEHSAWKDDCFACHTWLGKIDAAKCASCHDDGKGGAIKLAGFASHHLRRDLDCARCHVEHRGERGKTSRQTAAEYEASCAACHSGFETTPHVVRGEIFLHTSHGEKQKLLCSTCHDVRMDAPRHGAVTLAQNACVACHMKHDHPEKPVLATPWREVAAAHAPWENECARCHGRAADVRPALCADCHKRPDGTVVVFEGFGKHHLDPALDCAQCHTEHKGRTGVRTTLAEDAYREKCTLCHAGYAAWKGEVAGHAFSHAGHVPEKLAEQARRPGAPAAPAGESSLGCERCHDARASARASHGKLVVGLEACTACHLANRPDAPVGALARGHAAIADCALCHSLWHAPDAKLCVTCHRAEAAKRTPAPPKEPNLFPSHALQERLACLDCHTDHKGGAGAKGRGASGTERLPSGPVTALCTRCHNPPGGGVYAQTAERSTRRSPAADPLAPPPREIPFDHARHTALECDRCHDPEPAHHARRPGDPALPLRLERGACLACHHAPGETKKACADCHDTEARFLTGAFPASARTAPPDAHVRLVACADCHKLEAGGFAPTREQCVRCHGEDFGKLYDTARASIAAGLASGTVAPDHAAAIRRYGLHDTPLARLLLSPEPPAGRK